MTDNSPEREGDQAVLVGEVPADAAVVRALVREVETLDDRELIVQIGFLYFFPFQQSFEQVDVDGTPIDNGMKPGIATEVGQQVLRAAFTHRNWPEIARKLEYTGVNSAVEAERGVAYYLGRRYTIEGITQDENGVDRFVFVDDGGNRLLLTDGAKDYAHILLIGKLAEMLLFYPTHFNIFHTPIARPLPEEE